MTGNTNIFNYSIKNVRRKPFRTGILLAAIAILVSSLVFAVSFIVQVNAGLRTMSERLGADVIVVPAGSRGAAEDVLVENRVKSFYMDRDVIDRLSKIKGIGQMTAETYLVTMGGICCDVPDALVVAFDQDTDFIITPWLKKKLGRTLKPGEAIVGATSAFNIDVGLIEVDSQLFGNVFKMVGVLDKTGTGLDNAIFIDKSNIESIIRNGKSGLKPDQISIVFIKAKEGVNPKTIVRDITNNFLDVNAVARKDLGKDLIMTFKEINSIFYLTVALACLLSLFLAWAIFSAMANERVREVGIMRAIGAKESHVVSLFLAEIGIIGAAGSAAGIAAGTFLSIELSKGFTILRKLPIGLNPHDRIAIAAACFIIGIGICLVGSFSSLRRLKKLEPLAAIKES
jgi:putative ABC transport system permease protein